MCTAISYKNRYFGRNLDYDISYGEGITLCPRNFPLTFKEQPILLSHHAIIGMAIVSDNYPLFFDAINEKGLFMSGLLFPDNAKYFPENPEKINITPFEFIPYILGKFSSVSEAREEIENINLLDIPFSKDLPLTPLHWILSDSNGSLTIESTKDGLKIYDNPVGVLTNNPPFDFHLHNLSNFIGLSPKDPQNTFSASLPLRAFSRGMGAIGLPGDFSSQSRFVKACFLKENSVSGDTEFSDIGQFFHILESVSQVRGSVATKKGGLEITLYSSCCDNERGIYYYKTYDNSSINGVSMLNKDLNSSSLFSYPLITKSEMKIL
ncbi:MAG: choloylglycine hydrolase [Clostridia bacterium]|nr:choloylglycine hydrolase [Clostridia bacterium]